MSTVLRLDRWLSNHGIGSRREVRSLIFAGKVSVNGAIITSPDTKATEGDSVNVNAKTFTLRQFVYYMMNKPAGVITASRDKTAPTVMDLLPSDLVRPGLFPAGRLDKDTEGLLIITNDGEFSHKMLSPKAHLPKTYRATLSNSFDYPAAASAFAKGVDIGDGDHTSPALLKMISEGEQPEAQLTIYEGMYHQVKRMFQLFGVKVTYLKRISIGSLELDQSLPLGETKRLDDTQIEAIFSKGV